MANDYTPGPWNISPEDQVLNKYHVTEHCINATGVVGVAYVPEGRTVEEGQSNARLIAAAPELLEALKWTAAALQLACDSSRKIYETNNIRTAEGSRKVAGILDAANEAIGKALNP